MHPLYQQMETSVFERMSLAAAKHGAVNLGQGFPDFGWPEEILQAAARAVIEGSNQYAPSRGLPALREAVAPRYSETQLDRPDPPGREGQDGETVLTELGYGADAIAELRACGALL